MILDLTAIKIFIRPGKTDLRKGANGLLAIIQESMKGNPFSESVFLFCNKDRKLLKAIWWDKSGFWLSQKRLEKAHFPWAMNEEAAQEITADELKMLLSGIDFFKAHKPLEYKKVC
jgi:transposase